MRQAFTAIELLIVIAIMVMMIGLALPSISESMGRSKVANAANAIQEAHRQARLLARTEGLPAPTAAPAGQAHFGVHVGDTYAEVIYGGSSFLDADGRAVARFDFPKGVVAVSGGTQANVDWAYQYGTGYPIAVATASGGYPMPGSLDAAANIGVPGGVVGDLQVRSVDGTASGRHHGAVRIFKTGACHVELE